MDQRLINAVASGNIVILTGTGVSAAISGGSTATWRGLLESGVSRLDGLSSPGLIDNLRRNLEFGFDNDDLPTVLQSADRLRQEFNGVGSVAFAKWLSDDIGQLPTRDDRLVHALHRLPFPILTTNYDTLLATNNRRAVSWRDTSAMQEIMAGTSRDIGHLHGVWSEPDSIVLSATDYENLLRAEGAQVLQRSVSFLKSILYIGYGAGLADPNFSRLISLHSQAFPGTSLAHFRLCRASEYEDLVRAHAADHIVPVVYGDEYEDLVPFLDQLSDQHIAAPRSPAGIIRDYASTACIELSEQMISESILAESLDSSEQVSLRDVILPPILLPVPHAEFIRSQRTEGEQSYSRSNPYEDARSSEVILLAGDEGSGLSTAANWMAYEAATHLGGAAPLATSFRQVGAGPRPLARLIATTARNHGWIDQVDDELPPHVLILHDYSPYVSKLSDRAVSDIASSDAVVRIITCSVGSEDDVAEKLKLAGVQFNLRYIGRLGSKDVAAYAKIAAPGNYRDVAEKVIDVLRSESLPRNPLTVGLLISVIVRGTTLTAQASQTTVLDDYVGALLGRGDPHEDARLGMDQSSREALLSILAKHFVMENTGGVAESEALRVFEDGLTRLSWKESAAEVLQSLISRRLLRRTEAKIVFGRSSFLHLFAAKRAMSDEDFREYLLRNPLYYSAILTDYAALRRHDGELVARLNDLLSSEDWSTTQGGVFSELEPRPQPAAVERRESRENEPAEPTDVAQVDPLDFEEDVDSTPFPITQHEELPVGLRMLRVLELVSAVLRDSDQIEDIDKKRLVLTNVLHHWGLLMSSLDRDPDFISFVREMGARAAAHGAVTSSDDALDEDESAKKVAIDEFAKLFPAALAFAGIQEYLASRRLLVPLTAVLATAGTEGNLELVITSSFMLLVVREPGWVDQMRELISSQGNIWVIRNFLWMLMVADYFRGNVASSEESRLKDLLVDIVAKSTKYHSNSERVAHRAKVARDLEEGRLKFGRRMTDGDTLD